ERRLLARSRPRRLRHQPLEPVRLVELLHPSHDQVRRVDVELDRLLPSPRLEREREGALLPGEDRIEDALDLLADVVEPLFFVERPHLDEDVAGALVARGLVRRLPQSLLVYLSRPDP